VLGVVLGPVQVDSELAVDPEIGRGAESLGQAIAVPGVTLRLPLMIAFTATRGRNLTSARLRSWLICCAG